MNGQRDVHSVLGDHIRTFLAHQRALGKRFETEEEGLRQLERYLLIQQVTTLEAITPAVLEAFVLSRPRQPRSVNSLLSTLRRFFGWLVFHEVLIQSPLQASPGAVHHRGGPSSLTVPRPNVSSRPPHTLRGGATRL